MTREPDRFEAKAGELRGAIRKLMFGIHEGEALSIIVAALRREREEALGEAAQIVEDTEIVRRGTLTYEPWDDAQDTLSNAAKAVRALASPAAAPATESVPAATHQCRVCKTTYRHDGGTYWIPVNETPTRCYHRCLDLDPVTPPSEPVAPAPSLESRKWKDIADKYTLKWDEEKVARVAAEKRIAELEGLLREAREALELEGYCTDPAPDSLCARIDAALASPGAAGEETPKP